MVSFRVAVVTAFVGAAAAGVIPWLQTTRDQVSAARIAREYLIENLKAAEKTLDAALQTHEWWPPVAPPPTGAWHEYHAVLRDDLGVPAAGAAAETIKNLDDLNAWAVTQLGEQERRFDIVYEANLRCTPEQLAENRDLLDELTPTSVLGEQENKAIQKVHASVEVTLGKVQAAPRRAARRRWWGPLRLGVPVLLAVVAVILAITIQPTFTSDKLDQALAKELPGAVVSCDQSNGYEDQWDCFVAYPATRTTVASARRFLSVWPADGVKFAQTGGPPSGLRKLLEYRIEKAGKTNNFFGLLVGRIRL